MLKTRSIRRTLPALLLTVLLAGCVCNTPPPPAVVLPPQRPALPPEARQPELPEICSPTCSDGLTRLREQLLRTLTEPE